MLRGYQKQLKADIHQAWGEGHRNVMSVAPTGSGKTVLFCDILKEHAGPAVSIVHRQELLSQMALALNREKVRHAIIAPLAVIRQIIALEMETHGHSLYSASAHLRVAAVDTLIKRPVDRWTQAVTLAVIDEGHHTLADNKWGKALAMFPNARGLFPTAHAIRADGCGLGRCADGLVDKLVIGPSCRELIDGGYLCDYVLRCPATDVHFEELKTTASGELSAHEVHVVMDKSKRIVGDVVEGYMERAPGKLGITFAIDIDYATRIATAYRARGVPAEIITAKTPLFVRSQLMKKFRNREILQLVSVDVLGEGVDVPAIEVVSMARPTASFQLYAQQFGRGLRTVVDPFHAERWDSYTDIARKDIIAASRKPRAIIIDHVGNWKRHGLPDVRQVYSLERRERGSRKNKGDPLRSCLKCTQPYERFLNVCPYCDTPKPAPAGRGTPEEVDGCMIDLDPTVLAQLRAQVNKIDGAPPAVPGVQGGFIKRSWNERQAAQQAMRAEMALWAGWQINHLGLDEREAQRKFFITFGFDVVTACTLGRPEAEALREKIKAELDRHSIVEERAA